jgi:hypothetical protein
MNSKTHLPLCFALLSLVALAGRATAHPAAGVVVDAKGNACYSDLERVWRVAPDGRKQVVVSGVHTHELSLDAAGNLYGEHLWYEGEKTDKWPATSSGRGSPTWSTRRDTPRSGSFRIPAAGRT